MEVGTFSWSPLFLWYWCVYVCVILDVTYQTKTISFVITLHDWNHHKALMITKWTTTCVYVTSAPSKRLNEVHVCEYQQSHHDSKLYVAGWSFFPLLRHLYVFPPIHLISLWLERVRLAQLVDCSRSVAISLRLALWNTDNPHVYDPFLDSFSQPFTIHAGAHADIELKLCYCVNVCNVGLDT